jgi:hypothetical protein
MDPSVGSKGDAYDKAMAEAWVSTFKNELVDGRRFSSFEYAEHEIPYRSAIRSRASESASHVTDADLHH